MNHVEMMRLAESVALQSVCKRAQVGAVVRYTSYEGCVSNPWTTATGHNKRPCGGVCEGEDGRTLPDVIHAEHMAIDAALSLVIDDWEQYSMTESALYVTRQPCINCAKLIVHAGIGAVYYRDADDKTDGLEWLKSAGVHVDSGWIAGQQPTVLEQVQKTWADRWQNRKIDDCSDAKPMVVKPKEQRDMMTCCEQCRSVALSKNTELWAQITMICCPNCGNKRCPKAQNHNFKCTRSNQPNQVGELEVQP